MLGTQRQLALYACLYSEELDSFLAISNALSTKGDTTLVVPLHQWDEQINATYSVLVTHFELSKPSSRLSPPLVIKSHCFHYPK
jgi:hypothetical protein